MFLTVVNVLMLVQVLVSVSDVGERLDLVSISNFCVPDNGMVCVFDIGECL